MQSLSLRRVDILAIALIQYSCIFQALLYVHGATYSHSTPGLFGIGNCLGNVFARLGRCDAPMLALIESSSAPKTSNVYQVIYRARGGSEENEVPNVKINTENKSAEDESEAESNVKLAAGNSTNATQTTSGQLLNLTFGATNPHDGSDSDPDGIPSRFLQMKKNNRGEAKEAFRAHVIWREELRVNTLLARSHPKYDICKAMVPHYFAGRDPHNNIIFVQRPAFLDFELMRRNNATMDDLLLHYVYVIEYCWNILDPGPPERVMTNILDMRGLSFRHMKNQEYIGFGKRFVQMMSSNYPGRSYKTLIINAPKWFHALYKLFKPLLRESTRQKIVILKSGSQQDSALKFYLGDSLPDDLVSGKQQNNGGENGDDQEEKEQTMRYFIPVEDPELCTPGPNSMIEFEMRQFCINQLNLANETLQEVQ